MLILGNLLIAIRPAGWSGGSFSGSVLFLRSATRAMLSSAINKRAIAMHNPVRFALGFPAIMSDIDLPRRESLI
jgi:hypothetical protein